MLRFCESHGTLIVPEWPSAPWWPMLWEGSGWCNYVKAAVLLPDQDVFVGGLCEWNLFDGFSQRWPVWALRLCFADHCSICRIPQQ